MAGDVLMTSWCATTVPAAALRAGQSYLLLRALGAPLNSTLMVLQAASRGMRRAHLSLRAVLVCNTVNLVLDPVAIFTLGWGLPGAAAATVTGQVCPPVCLHSTP